MQKHPSASGEQGPLRAGFGREPEYMPQYHMFSLKFHFETHEKLALRQEPLTQYAI